MTEILHFFVAIARRDILSQRKVLFKHKSFFNNRVVSEWNSLSQEVMDSNSLDTFKQDQLNAGDRNDFNVI